MYGWTNSRTRCVYLRRAYPLPAQRSHVFRNTQSFFSTESLAGGSGGIHIGGRPIWVYGGLIAGGIYGMAGSRALNSPSIYWVWRPTAPTSPPFNNMPALYRVPWNGGVPEVRIGLFMVLMCASGGACDTWAVRQVVTLHAELCKQMTIIDDNLYCLSIAGSFFKVRRCLTAIKFALLHTTSRLCLLIFAAQFVLTKPNSIFAPMSVAVPANPRGFVASRSGVLFVHGGDGRLYRSDMAPSVSVALPINLTSPWAPTLYNAPTDRLLMSIGAQLHEFVGLVSVRVHMRECMSERFLCRTPSGTVLCRGRR